MQIIVGPFQFQLSEPFTEGYVLNLAEAKAMNALRAQRIRNIVMKKIEKMSREELVEETNRLDREFRFTAHGVSAQASEDTFLHFLREVAREQAEAGLRQAGRELTEEAIDGLMPDLQEDSRVIEEAQVRFEAMKQATREALQDLIGDGEGEAR